MGKVFFFMARPSSVEARDESCVVAQDQNRVARVDQTVMVDVRSSFLLRRERNQTHGAQAEQCVGRVDIAVAVYVAQLGGGGNDDFDLGRIAAINRCGGDCCSPTDGAVTMPCVETVAVCSSLLTQVRFLTVTRQGR